MARVYKKFGSRVLPRELENIGLENIPQYDLYDDETQNKQMFPQLAEELELMIEVGDIYRGAELLLPRGYEMARGHVVAWSHNTNENIMSRAHMIQFLKLGCIR